LNQSDISRFTSQQRVHV